MDYATINVLSQLRPALREVIVHRRPVDPEHSTEWGDWVILYKVEGHKMGIVVTARNKTKYYKTLDSACSDLFKAGIRAFNVCSEWTDKEY